VLFLARLNRVLYIVAGLSLAVIVLVTVIDVISSSARGRPITGVYEVVEVALVYLVFLGIPETFRREQNITVDVADHFFSPAVIAVLRSLGAVISVVYLALLEWSMFRPALDAWRFGDFKSESGIPFWFVWLPILGGTVVAIAASAIVMVRVLSGPGSKGRHR
jgi:TRAP-type C4-dicarboxylate transport system permease small subunit